MELMINPDGIYTLVAKTPIGGPGFRMAYHDGKLIQFNHFKDGKIHGLYREYFESEPDQLRVEKSFADGIIDGRWREWDIGGLPVRDDTYSMGLITPIVRYKGSDTNGATIHRSRNGASYSNFRRVGQIKVGMTTEEVSGLLKADFSPKQGVMFLAYQLDQYLFIGFKDDRVSVIRRGHNGVCLASRF
jgi:hypothetical protein